MLPLLRGNPFWVPIFDPQPCEEPKPCLVGFARGACHGALAVCEVFDCSSGAWRVRLGDGLRRLVPAQQLTPLGQGFPNFRVGTNFPTFGGLFHQLLAYFASPNFLVFGGGLFVSC